MTVVDLIHRIQADSARMTPDAEVPRRLAPVLAQFGEPRRAIDWGASIHFLPARVITLAETATAMARTGGDDELARRAREAAVYVAEAEGKAFSHGASAAFAAIAVAMHAAPITHARPARRKAATVSRR